MEYKLSDLEAWDEKICSIAEKHGLNWYPIEYESIDYFSMLGVLAFHGMPSHFSHWSYGKNFERTHRMYNAGMEGLPFEIIINSNPSIAYLMRENPLYLQILIMAHCVGHSDFFKNNRTFADTRPDTIVGRSRAAKKRIQGYLEDPSIGIDSIEATIDACHAVQFQVQRPGWRRRTREEVIEAYRDRKKLDPDVTEIDFNRNPIEPDFDILGFISENGDLPDWKRDVIEVCRDEGKYFWPQIQTKVMNEGWASYWHYTICHELDLPPDLHVAVIKSHNQVIRPQIGGINPYHLGFNLFQKIKERRGVEEMFLAREVHHDASFIRQYLTQEDCEDLNLFTYSRKNSGDVTVDDVSDEDGWETVKNDLVRQVGGGSIPILYVDVAKRNGSLMLGHEHDGRDLDVSEATAVLEHLETLWGCDVVINTTVDGNLRTIKR